MSELGDTLERWGQAGMRILALVFVPILVMVGMAALPIFYDVTNDLLFEFADVQADDPNAGLLRFIPMVFAVLGTVGIAVLCWFWVKTRGFGVFD